MKSIDDDDSRGEFIDNLDIFESTEETQIKASAVMEECNKELGKRTSSNNGEENNRSTSNEKDESFLEDCKPAAVNSAATTGLRQSAEERSEQESTSARSSNALELDLIAGGNSQYVDTWERMYAKLLEFQAINGHCRVPNRYTKDPRLGAWVAVQRRHYKLLKSGRRKKASLTPEREQRLENIGFQWSCDVPWKTYFIQLLEFVAINGHAQVPMKWEKDSKLSTWVSAQRREYKNLNMGLTSTLTNDQVKLLNSVGFVWQAERGGKKRFREGNHVPVLDKALASVASPVYQQTAIKMLQAFGEKNTITESAQSDVGTSSRISDNTSFCEANRSLLAIVSSNTGINKNAATARTTVTTTVPSTSQIQVTGNLDNTAVIEAAPMPLERSTAGPSHSQTNPIASTYGQHSQVDASSGTASDLNLQDLPQSVLLQIISNLQGGGATQTQQPAIDAETLSAVSNLLENLGVPQPQYGGRLPQNILAVPGQHLGHPNPTVSELLLPSSVVSTGTSLQSTGNVDATAELLSYLSRSNTNTNSNANINNTFLQAAAAGFRTDLILSQGLGNQPIQAPEQLIQTANPDSNGQQTVNSNILSTVLQGLGLGAFPVTDSSMTSSNDALNDILANLDNSTQNFHSMGSNPR